MTIHTDHSTAILAFLASHRGWHTAEDISAAVSPGTDPGVIAVECRALTARAQCRREFNAQKGIAQYSVNVGRT